ncbi:MAG: fructose-6-phosphate aldolase [Candidatus Latescibacterota bacterium]|nr:MAG: fructose-6-phosphate aldolase [Candidatus Latescibacterota bacterium]
MKFFLDSADVNEIREAASFGIADGVTTNPTLLAKQGGDPFRVLEAIAREIEGPVNAEVIGEGRDTIVREGRKLREIAPNICVKIPMTKEGLRAVRVLSGEGIDTTVTLVFSSSQALLAAKAGATYVCPFVGRLDDIGQVGMDVIREIAAIYQAHPIRTEILAASIRSPLHVVEAALAGAHIATVPFGVVEQMLRHPLTDIGIEKFLADWKKLGVSIE